MVGGGRGGVGGGRGGGALDRIAGPAATAAITTRSLVWTPALAAGQAQATAINAKGNSSDHVSATAVTRRESASPPLPPVVKARTSTRRAAEAVEAASKQSADEISANLALMQRRLEEVKAHEEEVRGIVNAHLKREAELKKILEDLFVQHRGEEELSSISSSPLLANPATAIAITNGGGGHLSVPGQSPSPPNASIVKIPTGSQGSEYRKTAGFPRALKTRKTGTGASSLAAGVSGVGGGGAGPGMLLAMAMGGGGDGLLTRDADTMTEYVLLMSAEALGEEQTGTVGAAAPERILNERWHQPGLSMSEALDRAAARSIRPHHISHLLPLLAAMRPSSSSGAWGRTAIYTPLADGKRKGNDVAARMSTSEAAGVSAAEGGTTVGAVAMPPHGAKRRRIDPNAIMCPFELNGVCNDDDCRYQHMDAFLRGSSSPQTSTSTATVAATGRIQPSTTSTTASSASGDNQSKDRRAPVPTAMGVAAAAAAAAAAAVPGPMETTISSSSSSSGGRRGTQRDKPHFLPGIQFVERTVEARTSQQQKAPRSSGSAGGGGPPGPERAKPIESETEDIEQHAVGRGIEGGRAAGGDGGVVVGARPGDGKGDEEGSGSDSGGGDDFLALPKELKGGVSAKASDDVSGDRIAEVIMNNSGVVDASPSALAKSFAQTVSGVVGGSSVEGGGGGSRVKAKNGGRREERYYSGDTEGEGEGASQSEALVALTEDQLIALEARLSEDEACDVEGWLLVAMHRLPRTGQSAMAVLNAVQRIPSSNESTDDAVLKPALRVIVKGLEKCEQGQAEELWALYLTLYALVPGFSADAVDMAEEQIDNFFASRRMWRLYCCISQRRAPGGRQSLRDKIALHWRRIEVLLEPADDVDDDAPPPTQVTAAESTATAEASPEDTTERQRETAATARLSSVMAVQEAAPTVDDDGDEDGVSRAKDVSLAAAGSAVGDAGDVGDLSLLSAPVGVESGAAASSTNTAAATVGAANGGAATAAEGGEASDRAGDEHVPLGSDTLGMIAYLVLERCSVLAQAGYVLQANAEVLEALGQSKLLRAWYDEGEARRSLLRVPGKESDGGQGVAEGARDGNNDASGEHVEGGGLLPQGIAETFHAAPREMRCLLWLTVLHLLVMGVMPTHAIIVAEDVGRIYVDTADGVNAADENPSTLRRRSDVLQWPKESLSSDSPAGKRLAASAELRDLTNRIFMSALQDAELVPSTDGRVGSWAPPLRVQDALLPSAVEAHAARAGGMAPAPSALQGASLALALNWLTFCCRREKSVGEEQQEVRTVALACCRRFQLTRPDNPAFLEHTLLEHGVLWKKRSLGDVYQEISYAFGENGAAEVARRERGEEGGEGVMHSAVKIAEGDALSPSGGCLEAVYAFLRFLEARESDRCVRADPAARAAAAAFSPKTDAARAVLREALVDLWVKTAQQPQLGGKINANAWLRNSEDEKLCRAMEGAKASLFRWADGKGGGGGGGDGVSLSAERQLSTVFVALWVLGGPATAIGTLDHVLSAESFSNMPPGRRRMLWLQRLEAAAVLSEQAAGTGDPMHGLREVALRALADHRARPRPRYKTLAHYVACTLEQRPEDEGGAADVVFLSAASVSWFAHDVLTVYADRFRAVKRGGVDWLIVAEALDSAGVENRRSHGGSRGEAPPGGVLALLNWVDRAHIAAAVAGQSGMDSEASERAKATAMVLRSNARPYAEKALATHGARDPGLAGAAAALEAATGRPDRAQRILEAALREQPLCSCLWESRLALEAGFGGGSRERARTTVEAAASSGALLRLRCDVGLATWRELNSNAGENAVVHGGRTVGRVLGAISNPQSRRETRSLSLLGALIGGGSGGREGQTTALPIPQVPRSLFLLTNLVSLSLAGNGLLALPAALGNLLTTLRSLDASSNALTSLPPTLSRLSESLRVLRLTNNQLPSPLANSPLGNLTSLRFLDLEGNRLSQFPTLVMGLPELRTLKLARNRFSPRAPPRLSDALPKLEELTLPDG